MPIQTYLWENRFKSIGLGSVACLVEISGNFLEARADILNFSRRGAEGILELRRGAIIIDLKWMKINIEIVIKRMHILLSPDNLP
jgi:hypothetical protein